MIPIDLQGMIKLYIACFTHQSIDRCSRGSNMTDEKNCENKHSLNGEKLNGGCNEIRANFGMLWWSLLKHKAENIKLLFIHLLIRVYVCNLSIL